MTVSRICLTLALLAIGMAAHAAEGAGWYVVLGSFPADDPSRMSGDLQQTTARMAPCELRTFNDF